MHFSAYSPQDNVPDFACTKSVKTRETYVVCLDCGAEFQYDWKEMRVQKPVTAISRSRIQEKPLRTA